MSLSGTYITKMFRLKKLLVSEGIFNFFFFFFFLWGLWGIKIRDIFHVIVFFEQIGIDMFYLYIFLITMHEIDTAA